MQPSEPPAANPVAGLAREVEEFVASAGWDQPPQLFALVPTAALLDEQPELAGQLDRANPLTPVAQEALPEGDLAESLGRIAWPEIVVGCALAQEIIVLPPDVEAELEGVAEADAERLRRAAADHPRRTEARLVAAVLREGDVACVMRLRGTRPDDASADADAVDEIVESPDLAPNLLEALKTTFLP
ncbi:PPA1309 family protein [Amycolatopsis sp. NPDC023774]|uniref:PPA1309 family protein n=1 Tax=Amycolatopsis sp. NPDC023774 TaxID=3155015 RepID=UPI0033E47566